MKFGSHKNVFDELKKRFVSNCGAPSGRLWVAEQMRAHGLRVDIYGACGTLQCPKGACIAFIQCMSMCGECKQASKSGLDPSESVRFCEQNVFEMVENP